MPRMRRIPAAEAMPVEDETRQFIQQVRRTTRRKFTAEEKVRVVLEGFRRETRVSDLCRREGINPNVYYAWLKEFMEACSRDGARRHAAGGGEPQARQRAPEAAGGRAVAGGAGPQKTAIPEFR